MKFQNQLSCALIASILLANPVQGEPRIAQIKKTYIDGSSIAMSCSRARPTHCQVLLSYSGGSREISVDFGEVGEIPTLEHIELIGFSADPLGGAVLTSVECRRRDEGVLSEDVPDVMCFKLFHLSGGRQIVWGATEIRGQLEPVAVP